MLLPIIIFGNNSLILEAYCLYIRHSRLFLLYMQVTSLTIIGGNQMHCFSLSLLLSIFVGDRVRVLKYLWVFHNFTLLIGWPLDIMTRVESIKKLLLGKGGIRVLCLHRDFDPHASYCM